MSGLNALVCFIFLIVFPLLSFADERIKVKMIDFGLYEAKSSGRMVQSYGLYNGYFRPSSSLEQIKETNGIIGSLGTTFGFRYMVTMLPLSNSREANFCGSHPPIINSVTGIASTKDCYKYLLRPGKVQWHTFFFEDQTEIVRGVWRLYIEKDGDILIEKEFDVK
ncbi:DUF3859 domain-containing protein [Sinobacterium caligoides]|uniref:DUF3859 domain-containing protein n=1 Tax=Sinobacterium caligoides TaxID=933926 RepID=UPI0011CE3A5A|nr:DUF3859 domain-containing protein [Sinobacterium caligoides]